MFVVDPELFESKGFELRLSERIFRVLGESMQAVSFHIDWKDLSARETDENVAVQKLVALV